MKINDIAPEGLTVEIEETLDLFDEGGPGAPVRARMAIKPQGQGIFHVSGTISATAQLECSRCLKRFPFPITGAVMEFELMPQGSLKTGAEHELGRGELDTEFYEGDAIEPLSLIREQALLAIP